MLVLMRLLLAWPLICLALPQADAQDAVTDFFHGKQVNIIVGSSAGGGYDTYGRLIARHLGAHIPGNPEVVVQNMPGAGSNKATGYVYSVAPKDGTTIGAIFPGAILDPLIGDVQVQHDPSKFNYLGSANADIYICFVPATPRRRRSRMFSATRSSSAPAIPAARRAICRR